MAYDRFIIRDCLWVVSKPVGVAVYDFDFRRFFDWRTPREEFGAVSAAARIGAFEDYAGEPIPF